MHILKNFLVTERQTGRHMNTTTDTCKVKNPIAKIRNSIDVGENKLRKSTKQSKKAQIDKGQKKK